MASRGSGGSLGAALVAALADAADGTVGVRKSYTAKGWHAQISKLTSSPRGYQAAEKVGLSATARTLKSWLSWAGDGDPEPSQANQRKIAEAYAIMAGRWPQEVEHQDVSVTGTVQMGPDVRDRGSKGHSPLLVDGRAGSWQRLRDAWESGDVDADDFEEWWIEDVLEADLGEGSEPWEFPGSSYTVVIG